MHACIKAALRNVQANWRTGRHTKSRWYAWMPCKYIYFGYWKIFTRWFSRSQEHGVHAMIFTLTGASWCACDDLHVDRNMMCTRIKACWVGHSFTCEPSNSSLVVHTFQAYMASKQAKHINDACIHKTALQVQATLCLVVMLERGLMPPTLCLAPSPMGPWASWLVSSRNACPGGGSRLALPGRCIEGRISSGSLSYLVGPSPPPLY